MGFMAVLALHVHGKMHGVLADLGHVRMTPEAVAARRLAFALSMRLVTLIAVELHGRLFVEYDLYGLFDRGRFRLEEPHVHGCVVLQTLFDILVSAMAVEALHAPRLQVLGAVRMAVEASQAAHALAVHCFAHVAFSAKLFRGQEMMES
jgi:hypothetical protein